MKILIKLIYKIIIVTLKFFINSDIGLSKKFYKYNGQILELANKGIGVGNFDKNGIKNGEFDFLKKISKLLPANSIVFDVGANEGDYSVEILNNFDNPFLYCFEPHPVTYEKLRNNITNRAKTFNIAVTSDKNEEVVLYDVIGNQESRCASIYKNVLEKTHDEKNLIEYKVEANSLDNIVNDLNINKIDLLKIDTEGNELNVLKGAQNLILKNKINIIQFEFNSMNIVSKSFFINFMEILPNYEFYRILIDGLVKLEYNEHCPILTEIFHYQNIVAINKEFTHLKNVDLKNLLI